MGVSLQTYLPPPYGFFDTFDDSDRFNSENTGFLSALTEQMTSPSFITATACAAAAAALLCSVMPRRTFRFEKIPEFFEQKARQARLHPPKNLLLQTSSSTPSSWSWNRGISYKTPRKPPSLQKGEKFFLELSRLGQLPNTLHSIKDEKISTTLLPNGIPQCVQDALKFLECNGEKEYVSDFILSLQELRTVVHGYYLEARVLALLKQAHGCEMKAAPRLIIAQLNKCIYPDAVVYGRGVIALAEVKSFRMAKLEASHESMLVAFEEQAKNYVQYLKARPEAGVIYYIQVREQTVFLEIQKKLNTIFCDEQIKDRYAVICLKADDPRFLRTP